jgi:hypothetical protein
MVSGLVHLFQNLSFLPLGLVYRSSFGFSFLPFGLVYLFQNLSFFLCDGARVLDRIVE